MPRQTPHRRPSLLLCTPASLARQRAQSQVSAQYVDSSPTPLLPPTASLNPASLCRALNSDSQSTIWLGTDCGTLNRVKKHQGKDSSIEIVRVPFPATTLAKTQSELEGRASSFRALRKHLDSGSSAPWTWDGGCSFHG